MNAPELISNQSQSNRSVDPVNAAPNDFDLASAAQVGTTILFTGSAHAVVLARRVHALSGCRWGRFLLVDCGWPDSTLEQRLFDVLRPDSAPAAELHLRLLQPGTILLYEVGKLSRSAQVRLADALELGSRTDEQRRSRYRVMASTSEPLLQRVAAGTFDDRLYYRLNMLHVLLPPDTTS